MKMRQSGKCWRSATAYHIPRKHRIFASCAPPQGPGSMCDYKPQWKQGIRTVPHGLCPTGTVYSTWGLLKAYETTASLRSETHRFIPLAASSHSAQSWRRSSAQIKISFPSTGVNELREADEQKFHLAAEHSWQAMLFNKMLKLLGT